jgi:hypothetical protein
MRADRLNRKKGCPIIHQTEPSNAPMTLAQIVGHNVTSVLAMREWDRTRLADEAALLDANWDEGTIGAIENGTYDLLVSDLVMLAVLLGVAPHIFFYPPQNVSVAFTTNPPDTSGVAADLEEAVLYGETHIPGERFADWLWDPDTHAFSHANVSEENRWKTSQKTNRR